MILALAIYRKYITNLFFYQFLKIPYYYYIAIISETMTACLIALVNLPRNLLISLCQSKFLSHFSLTFFLMPSLEWTLIAFSISKKKKLNVSPHQEEIGFRTNNAFWYKVLSSKEFNNIWSFERVALGLRNYFCQVLGL